MKKKLRIKFWKAERALAIQVVKQEGLLTKKEEGFIHIIKGPELTEKNVYLRGYSRGYDFEISQLSFTSNQSRDDYFDKVIKAITDELFTGTGELKVGEVCEFSNDNEKWEVHPLITILREGLFRRYLANVGYNIKAWDCFEYARPLCKRTEPKVEANGEVITYTWEEE